MLSIGEPSTKGNDARKFGAVTKITHADTKSWGITTTASGDYQNALHDSPNRLECPWEVFEFLMRRNIWSSTWKFVHFDGISRTVDLHEGSRPTTRDIITNSTPVVYILASIYREPSSVYSSCRRIACLAISKRHYYMKVRLVPGLASLWSPWMKTTIVAWRIDEFASPT